jgi:F0F1-type ATP synthase delta subunit
LKSGIQKSFPGAAVNIIINSDIKGGMVIKADSFIIDQSLLTRIKYLFGQADV